MVDQRPAANDVPASEPHNESTTAGTQNDQSTTEVFDEKTLTEETTMDPAVRFKSRDASGNPLNDKNPAVHDGANSSDGEDSPKAEPEKEEGKDERSTLKTFVIMLSICMAVFLAAIDITIVTTALPVISDYFHSSSGFTWIGSAYLLANASTTTIWGKLSDIFGRKPALLAANMIFFVGSLICALSVNIAMLIAARVIQGIGSAGLIVLANICVGDLFSPRRRGAYYGMIGGVWALASSLGPILGGVFAEKVSWRWCFYINLPLDGLAFVLLFLFLDLKTPTTPFWAGIQAVDWLGSLLVIGGTLMFLFGLEFGGNEHPWASAIVICLIVFGVITFVIFGFVEVYVAKYPLLPARIFNKASNIASLGVCFIQSFVFISSSYYLPIYFQAARGTSPIRSGVLSLPQAVALSVTSMATGISIRKTGKYIPQIYIGLFLMVLGYGLYINLERDSSLAKIVIYQIIAGFGVGPNFQAPLIALQSLIPPSEIAPATAAFGFTRNLGTAISIVVGGAVFQNVFEMKEPQYQGSAAGAGATVLDVAMAPPDQRIGIQDSIADSLKYAWILYTVMSALGLVVAFFISSNVLSRQHEETKTGLEAQEAARQERLKEKEEKRNSRRSRDLEKDADRRRSTQSSNRQSVDVEKVMGKTKDASTA